ncbi:hypothetical protein J6590_018673 [Homalodisca vitripennis]|nr:hypothetical protein J6590_018673 [Homalodisca vitripennis]
MGISVAKSGSNCNPTYNQAINNSNFVPNFLRVLPTGQDREPGTDRRAGMSQLGCRVARLPQPPTLSSRVSIIQSKRTMPHISRNSCAAPHRAGSSPGLTG